MRRLWSYVLMTLCIVLTSARVMDYPGNRNDLHDNLISGSKEEKVVAPPSAGSFNIDSKGFPGNSNDTSKEIIDCQKSCLKKENMDLCKCDVLEFLNKVLGDVISVNEFLNEFDIILLGKQDILNLRDSELCKTLCNEGIKKPPCECT